LYWYYGFFAVLAGVLLVALRVGGSDRGAFARGAVGPLAAFSAAALLLLGPLLWVSFGHYAQIVGTAEDGLFPHPEVVGDSCWPAVPFLVGGGRHAGRALPALTTLLAVGGLAVHRDRRSLGLVALILFFFALMAGPLWPGGPYEQVYGLAGPLRRFWWPYRHVVVANLAIVALGSLGFDAVLARLRAGWRSWLAGAVALSVPLQLELARAPFHALYSKATVPTDFYTKVAELPGEVLLEPPLSPDVAATQASLIYQFDHHKTLLNGHALWVARVRPPQWDTFVSSNTFLAAMQALERGELPGEFRFAAADLAALRDAGLGVVTLNREYFPVKLDALLQAYDRVLTGLFGEPAVELHRAKAWRVDRWTGQDQSYFESFSWPAELGHGGPTLPVQAPRPASMAFRMPEPGKGAPEAAKRAATGGSADGGAPMPHPPPGQ
jgi:hypothetical protein